MVVNNRICKLTLVLKWVVVFVILRVLVGIVSNYPDYFPPNFDADFLFGRDRHFYGVYGIAFYTHILTTPFALVNGLVLMNESLRRSFSAQHRWLGRLQVFVVLLLVVPSSLWMSAYTLSGRVAGAGFAFLALITGFSVIMGWRRAVEKNFKEHRYWMTRCFLMLCSAIVLRIISGVATVLIPDAMWTYPFAAWGAWLIPWISLEGFELYMRSRISAPANELSFSPLTRFGEREPGGESS
jgi:hypothetical protein